MPDDHDRMREEALDWLVRLKSEDCCEADRRKFAAWAARNPQGLSLYAELEAQLAWMQRFRAIPFRAREEALRYRPPRRTLRRPFRLAVAAVALAGVGLATYFAYREHGVESRYVTAKGQHETLTLADGSRLELNTDSEIRVRVNRWRRSVELLRGEAYFSVSHDEQRPFEVRAGNGRIVDVGTEFEVYRQADRVVVAVREGAVCVTAGERRDLYARQAVAYNLAGEFMALPDQDPDTLTAWRTGQLVFRNRPLADLLIELGRYHDIRIRLDSPELGEFKVSGRFDTAKLDATINTIALLLPVTVQRLSEHELVLISRPPRSR